jgi:hypothetical protein
MLSKFDEEEFQALSDRIAATTIVNNAALRCIAAKLPLDGENVTLMIGDFFDPTDPRFDRLLRHVLVAVEEISLAWTMAQYRGLN